MTYLEEQLDALRSENSEKQDTFNRFIGDYTSLLSVLNEIAEADKPPETPPRSAKGTTTAASEKLPEVTRLRRKMRHLMTSLDTTRDHCQSLRKQRPEAQLLELELAAARLGLIRHTARFTRKGAADLPIGKGERS